MLSVRDGLSFGRNFDSCFSVDDGRGKSLKRRAIGVLQEETVISELFTENLGWDRMARLLSRRTVTTGDKVRRQITWAR